jgi:hypothetical protein
VALGYLLGCGSSTSSLGVPPACAAAVAVPAATDLGCQLQRYQRETVSHVHLEFACGKRFAIAAGTVVRLSPCGGRLSTLGISVSAFPSGITPRPV